MNQYYLVPVVARNINFEGKSLLEILGSVDGTLYGREIARVELQYGGGSPEYGFSNEIMEIVKKHNQVTSQMFRERGVPEKLVLVRDGDRLYELVTEKDVSVFSESFLDVFAVDPDSVVDIFYANPNYANEVSRFFSGHKKEESFQKRKSSNK